MATQVVAVEADWQRQTVENLAEAGRLNEQIELCGFSKDALSADARQALETTAKLCVELGVAEPIPLHILAVWAQLEVRKCRAVRLRAKLQQQHVVNQQEMQRLERVTAHLEEALASIRSKQAAQEARGAQEAQVLADLQAKDKEYARRLKKGLRHLEQLNLTPDVHHSNLVAKAERVQELKAQLKQQQEQLARYQGLPPSVAGVRLAVSQARQELQRGKQLLEGRLAQLGGD